MQLTVLLGAWLAVSFAIPMGPIGQLAVGQVRVLVCIAMGCLSLGLLSGIADQAQGSLPRRIQAGAESLFPPALPLLLLPICPASWRFLPAILSTLLAFCYAPRGAFARLGQRREWQLGLIGFAACLAIGCFAVGRSLAGSANNDAAYYFGMARHLVLTHRWDEPLVWQFLSQKPSISHWPFDYWHGCSALFLVPFMFVFGPTHLVAGSVMGALAGLAVLLFAYLIGVAAPLRNAGLQLLSVVLFAFSPAMQYYRYDVDTVAFVQLWLILSLIALSRRRLALASSLACLCFLFRADCFTLTVLLCAGAAYLAVREASPRRALLAVAAPAACFAALYVGYHWLAFGTPGPPAALLAAKLRDGIAPYYVQDHYDTWSLLDRFSPQYIAGRVSVALDSLQHVEFFPLYPLWLGGALIGAQPITSLRRGVDSIARCALFFGAALIALASPAVFASWRSMHPLLPVFVLAGGYGFDTLLEALPGWARGILNVEARRLLLGLCSLWLVLALLHPLELHLESPPEPAFAKELAALDSTFAGQPVMSARSWYVLAYTSAPAVALPFNGEQAISATLRRYSIQWLLIVNGEDTLGSAELVTALTSGRRSDIGGIPLALVRHSDAISLFRVQSDVSVTSR